LFYKYVYLEVFHPVMTDCYWLDLVVYYWLDPAMAVCYCLNPALAASYWLG